MQSSRNDERSIGTAPFLSSVWNRLRSRAKPGYFCLFLLALLPALLLSGCTANELRVAPAAQTARLPGSVHGGQQPVTGATIQLYAVGTSGEGSAATPLLKTQVLTNSIGDFDTGAYTCPSASSQVYLTSTGGNPGLASGTANAQIVEIVALGSCEATLTMAFVQVNEVTTVAAVYALAPYMKSLEAIGSGAADAPQLAEAFLTAAELADASTGRSPGTNVPAGQIVPSAKVNALANAVAACVNSAGGRAGDSSPCGLLFAYTASFPQSAPLDTAGALLRLAQAPAVNVLPIYLLIPPNGPFQPALSSAPSDWSLFITSPTPYPVFSPAPGSYTGSVTVTLSGPGSAAALHYTLDGSTPTSLSALYTGPITISSNTTVRAIAVSSGVSSLIDSGMYQVTAMPAQRLTFTNAPSPVGIGSKVPGTLLISSPSATPISVALLSSSPAVVQVAPSMIVVPAGQTSVPFTISGIGPGTSTLSAAALGYVAASTPITTVPALTTLRQVATQRGFLMGAAVDANEFGYFDPLTGDPKYAATLGTQYNMLEGENAMKWIVTRPGQTTYNFEPGDQLITFAQAHGMKVRGHNLAWNLFNPNWLNTLAATASPATMSQILQQHITTEVGHYQGKVFAWDVVNEAIDDNATGVGTQMKNSIWYNQPGIGLPGTGYVEQAFRWAHAVDPGALLFYNDYLIITPGPKFQAALNMMKDFVQRGVPINGIGLQVHTDTNGWPDSAGLAQVIQAFTQLGLQVHLSEVDVAIPVNTPTTAGTSTAAYLQAQAATYRRVLTVCLQNPGCTAFQTWGFTDNYSWVPANNPGLGAALPFDQNYNPVPAFDTLFNALQTVVPAQ